MLCVALLSDVGMSNAKSKNEKFGTARLGQMVLLVELIGKIQATRREREALGNVSCTWFYASGMAYCSAGSRCDIY